MSIRSFSFLALVVLLISSTQGCRDVSNSSGETKNFVADRKIAIPPEGKLYSGIFPGTDDIVSEDEISSESLNEYINKVGKKPTWVYFSDNWYKSRAFPEKTATWIREMGSIPFIRLMLRSSEEQNIEEDKFTLDNIIEGEFDDDLRRWASDAKRFETPLLVEYGTEVNGDWFSWNGRWNGGGRKTGYGDPKKADGPERFQDAYRHIIKIMKDEGAGNITWVFHVDSDDVPDKSWNRLENYYPGDDWIDWIGVSIYGASEPSDEDDTTFSEIMDEIYPRLTRLGKEKPVAVLEIGVAANNKEVDQAKWTEEALTELSSFRWPEVIGFAWWNDGWENDDDPANDTNMYIHENPGLAQVYRQIVGDNETILGKYVE